MKQKWTYKEIEEQYTLLPDEHALIKNVREKASLPFALLLTFYRNEKSFPKSFFEIPESILVYIGKQLNEQDINETISDFNLESRTASRFRTGIREFFSFREATLDDKKSFEIFKIYLIIFRLHAELRLMQF